MFMASSAYRLSAYSPSTPNVAGTDSPAASNSSPEDGKGLSTDLSPEAVQEGRPARSSCAFSSAGSNAFQGVSPSVPEARLGRRASQGTRKRALARALAQGELMRLDHLTSALPCSQAPGCVLGWPSERRSNRAT